MNTTLGILIPFIGTVLGASLVFFSKNTLPKQFENIIFGVSAGVMIAASIWSLIIPSIELKSIIPTSIGLITSFLFFFILDLIQNNNKKKIKKGNRMMLAITLHNIPEGMAVGVAFASYLVNPSTISLTSCLALSIGIAIQNFPEGFIVSVPLKQKGYTKIKAFIYGVISAIFELLGAIITLIFTNIITFALPFLLSFAAGAMIYVVIVELIPESDDKYHTNSIGFFIGFLIMMLLDNLF